MKILDQNSTYTFRSYFELPNDTDEILAEFNYRLVKTRVKLPKTNRHLENIEQLKHNLEETLPYVMLNSELARREILVAPILSRVAVICQKILRIEYPLKVNNLLQGSLDYLLRGENTLIVVEAKRDDLTRGFTQLAVEMIALSMWEENNRVIYGAVTLGSAWLFGILDAHNQTITEDISIYTVPDNVIELVKILVGILEGA
ncbi:MAG: hypothetical protein RMK91_01035 [Pseudanabaenaceae cyanobacterium SKYGB_i_bin29]|nr:hypothetical protein [Pseudanabaenaceae cyanobacterium SKYG29]MDW8420435.1 hypothetical protein [Pseudanabaenaceae cyanobacterium SKYGB_i_bin29]